MLFYSGVAGESLIIIFQPLEKTKFSNQIPEIQVPACQQYARLWNATEMSFIHGTDFVENCPATRCI